MFRPWSTLSTRTQRFSLKQKYLTTWIERHVNKFLNRHCKGSSLIKTSCLIYPNSFSDTVSFLFLGPGLFIQCTIKRTDSTAHDVNKYQERLASDMVQSGSKVAVATTRPELPGLLPSRFPQGPGSPRLACARRRSGGTSIGLQSTRLPTDADCTSPRLVLLIYPGTAGTDTVRERRPRPSGPRSAGKVHRRGSPASRHPDPGGKARQECGRHG